MTLHDSDSPRGPVFDFIWLKTLCLTIRYLDIGRSYYEISTVWFGARNLFPRLPRALVYSPRYTLCRSLTFAVIRLLIIMRAWRDTNWSLASVTVRGGLHNSKFNQATRSVATALSKSLFNRRWYMWNQVISARLWSRSYSELATR